MIRHNVAGHRSFGRARLSAAPKSAVRNLALAAEVFFPVIAARAHCKGGLRPARSRSPCCAHYESSRNGTRHDIVWQVSPLEQQLRHANAMRVSDSYNARLRLHVSSL